MKDLHIELDASHPAYAWLEKQADKIGARGHFGTHIDCYTSIPSEPEMNIAVHILDCRKGMPTPEEAAALPSLHEKALVLFTANIYHNAYGSKVYFDQHDSSITEQTLVQILQKSPRLILIDSYGIGRHGEHHIGLDKTCEAAGCYVVENIRIDPAEVPQIETIRVRFDVEYPSTGKPCTVSY